jgi:hypothetical protein
LGPEDDLLAVAEDARMKGGGEGNFGFMDASYQMGGVVVDEEVRCKQ